MGKVVTLDGLKKVDATLVDSNGVTIDTDIMGTRQAQAVSYPELLIIAGRIESALSKINAQLADITGEEDPL